MNNGQNKRKVKRLPVHLPVCYSIVDNTTKKILEIKAVTKDVSHHGLCFIASHHPETQMIDLTIQLPFNNNQENPKRSLKIKAKMVHSNPVSDDALDIFRNGVSFVELSEEDARLLDDFLQGYKLDND